MPRLESERLSVVVPCYNEEAVVEDTYHRLVDALRSLDMEIELLFVDDGSRDETEAVLRRLQAADPNVQVLLLARNFGHQVAVTAGLEAATGHAVVIIDADLQDPPEVIPRMVQLWRAGNEVVYGRRTEREGETAFKLLTAGLFYRTLRRMADTDIPLDTGDFRLLDRKVVDALRQMPEHDRFLRGMVSWVGFRQHALPYKRDPRLAGESKYPLRKMVSLAADGLLSFSVKPLRLATWAGGAALLAALAGMLYLLAAALQPWEASPTVGLLSASSFLGGVQLICLGILGEYVGRIYRASKQRPLYLLRDHLGAGEALPLNQPWARAA